MSKKIPSVISQSRPCDAAIAANTVVQWSAANVGNVKGVTVAATLLIAGVMEGGSNQSTSSPPNWYGKVTQAGIVQCRSVTGSAIAIGDLLGVADTAGRVSTIVVHAAGAGTLTGVVGVAQSAVASGDATDTLVDVLLTPGLQVYV